MRRSLRSTVVSAIPGRVRVWLKHFYDPLTRDSLWAVLKYFRRSPDRVRFAPELRFLARNGFAMCPYEFARKYHEEEIVVRHDRHSGMPYVMRDDRPLYFPHGLEDSIVRGCYNQLRIEQDRESPHRYITTSFAFPRGAVLADVGAAEGVFALDHVDEALHCFLFEPDPKWIKPLNQTFSPWRGKVTIVESFVSDVADGNTTTLDECLSESAVDLLKIDAEGEEPRVLRGATKCLRAKVSKVVACCYHKKNHLELLGRMLADAGFDAEPSKGWLLVPRAFDSDQSPPYFRRGVLRALKSNRQPA